MNVAQRVLLAIQPGKHVVAKAAHYIFARKKITQSQENIETQTKKK